MEKTNQLISKSTGDLEGIAQKILAAFPNHRIFAFYGEMGAGKTTFIKSICRVLKVVDTISSPTFAIVNVYQTSSGDFLNHFDCYRIKSIEEVYDIGYEDYFYGGDYCLIEWPENIESLLPEDTIKVEILIEKDSGNRIFKY